MEGVSGGVPTNDNKEPLESRSGDFLATMVALMPDATLVVDASGRIIAANNRASEIFGYAPGELLDKKIESLVPERVRHRHRNHRSEYMEAVRPRPMGAGLDLSGRRHDGREFPVDISLAPLPTDGELLVVAAVRDVTRQRAATAAQAELASIVSSSLDAIISTTVDGLVTSWNPAAQSLLGYTSEEILGEHVALLVPEHSSVVLEELLDGAFAGGSLGARDTTWHDRDGVEIDVVVRVSPLLDPSARLFGFSFVVRDIRERKAVERELRRALAEERRLEKQHAATAEIRLALLSDTTVRDALVLICKRASELVDAPVVALTRRTDDGTIVISAGVGLDHMVGTILAPGESFAERVMEAGESIEIPRRSDLSRVDGREMLPDGPTLGVPVGVGQPAEAALTFVRHEGTEPFSRASRLFAESLASQASLALELERARHDREQIFLLSDRERIGRDLHDHVIQRLFAAGLGLQSCLSFIDSSPARERVADAVEALDETIRDIRNTIFGLSRTALPQQLRAKVMEVAEEAGNALGFEPSLVFIGPVDTAVPPDVVPHVLAVIREGFANTARHASANAAGARIEVGAGKLTVTVHDDGVGIGTPTRSSGLSNLSERALFVGGTFVATTANEGGTRLVWVAPLER